MNRMNPRPLMHALSAPVQRLNELGPDGWVVAWVVGLVGAVTADLSVLLMGVLLLSSAVDWFFGRAAAHRRNDFDQDVSRWGLQSKIAGVLLVGLLRLLELVLQEAGVPDPHGLLAVVTAAALIYQDLDSIDLHRQALGGRPIPVLTAVLTLGRKLSDSLLPLEPADPPEELKS